MSGNGGVQGTHGVEGVISLRSVMISCWHHQVGVLRSVLNPPIPSLQILSYRPRPLSPSPYLISLGLIPSAPLLISAPGPRPLLMSLSPLSHTRLMARLLFASQHASWQASLLSFSHTHAPCGVPCTHAVCVLHPHGVCLTHRAVPPFSPCAPRLAFVSLPV